MHDERGVDRYEHGFPKRSVSEAERERVITILKDAYSSGHLDMDDFESRLEAAHEAASLGALNTLVSDLPAIAERAPAAMAPVAGSAGRISCFMSTQSISGKRLARSSVQTRVIMGEARLDYRDIATESGTLDLRLNVIMGSVIILVPRSMSVEIDATPIMAEIREHGRGGSHGSGPVLRIGGRVIMGEVVVRTE